MSKASRRTRRIRKAVVESTSTVTVVDFLRGRIANPDPRTPAEFLRDMRVKQAAGQLVNPAVTAPLLDRLQRAI